MLTRAEILEALRKMGYREAGELKRLCRGYEQFVRVHAPHPRSPDAPGDSPPPSPTPQDLP